MDSKFRINFRVPKEYQILVQKAIGDDKDSDFMFKVFDRYFNSPPNEVREIIVERVVEKLVEVEVVKEIRIDAEGTVKGHSVEISDLLHEELQKIKLNPEATLDALVAEICWGRIDWSKKKRSPATAQINGTSQNTTYETSQARVLYWKKQISETESWDEAGQELIREGITADTLLLEKDRNILTGKRR